MKPAVAVAEQTLQEDTRHLKVEVEIAETVVQLFLEICEPEAAEAVDTVTKWIRRPRRRRCRGRYGPASSATSNTGSGGGGGGFHRSAASGANGFCEVREPLVPAQIRPGRHNLVAVQTYRKSGEWPGG